jgi:hypothetical protein
MDREVRIDLNEYPYITDQQCQELDMSPEYRTKTVKVLEMGNEWVRLMLRSKMLTPDLVYDALTIAVKQMYIEPEELLLLREQMHPRPLGWSDTDVDHAIFYIQALKIGHYMHSTLFRNVVYSMNLLA